LAPSKLRRSCAGALYWSAVALTLPANALADDSAPLTLECAGELAFSLPLAKSANAISFLTTVPFGEGNFLALANPETGKIERPLYDMEVLSGSFQVAERPPEAIVWTRTSGRSGELIGQAIASDGQIFSLAIQKAAAGSALRPFVLFGTAAATLYRGNCE
jgi:hypothetical protein